MQSRVIGGTGAYLTPNGGIIEAALANGQLGYEDAEPFWGEAADATDSGILGLMEISGGAGTSNVTSTSVEADADGVWVGTIPTDPAAVAAAGGGFRGQLNQIGPEGLVGRYLEIYRVRLSRLPTAATNVMRYFVGCADSETNQAEPSDGAYIIVDDADPTAWFLRHARAGARISRTLGTTVVPTINVWQTLAVLTDVDAGTVTAYGANDGELLTELQSFSPVDIQPAVTIQTIAALSNDAAVAAVLSCIMKVDYVRRAAEWGVLR